MALGAELTAFLGRILASESALRVTFAKGDEVAFVAESVPVREVSYGFPWDNSTRIIE